MTLLLKASEILSTPQGSLVYYLLVLWAVIAGLGMAWGEWRRARNEQAQRLLLAMGGLVLLRVVYAVVALIASADWLDRMVLLPPLERFVDTVSISLLAWAFMPPLRREARIWNWVFGVNLALAAVVFIAFTFIWGQALTGDAGLSYNTFWQAYVWLVWQAALILLALVAVFRSRGEGWGTFVPAMVLMMAGVILQWFSPAVAPHLPVWQRLTNLMAYPLIAVAVYQEIVAGLRVHSRELQDISQASMDQIKSLLYLFEASQKTSGSLDLNTVLDNAVEGIAQVLEADQCAIAFPVESDPGQMRLVAIHNPTRKGRGEAVAFPLEYQLTVQQAIRRKKRVVVAESDNIQLKVLFAQLGSGETGPLLVQPLLTDGEPIGAIIVGNARSRREFTANEAKLCQSMAEQLVAAIQNARLYEGAQARVQGLLRVQREEKQVLDQAKEQVQELADRMTEAQSKIEELQQREEMTREARNALEIRLVSSRAEADTLSERLAVLETDLAQAHANAEAQLRWHEDELSRHQADWQESTRITEAIQAILQGMTAGVLVTDARGVIQEANVAAEILLDRGIEELQGLMLDEVSGDERWQQAVATASGGEAVRLTMQIGANTLMCDVAPLPDPEMLPDEVPRQVVVLQDISTEIEEQRDRLEAIATLSEELRTPITTIINYADLLLSEGIGFLGSAQRKYVTRIKAGAERVGQMTNDLTREAGGEERWTRPQYQKVDVNKLIEVTLAGTHCQLEDRSVTLDLDLPEDLPAVKADPDYLRRVVVNLLSNACLASAVGGQIQVQTTQSPTSPFSSDEVALNGDGFVVVSVKDSGGGLSEDALDRVFDRARPSQSPPGLGESGAGLALVKTLVEAHGGRLWVESEQGIGTTFSFVLPVNGVSEHAEAPVEDSVA